METLWKEGFLLLCEGHILVEKRSGGGGGFPSPISKRSLRSLWNKAFHHLFKDSDVLITVFVYVRVVPDAVEPVS